MHSAALTAKCGGAGSLSRVFDANNANYALDCYWQRRYFETIRKLLLLEVGKWDAMNIERRSLARSALSRRRYTRQASRGQTQPQVRRVEKITDRSPILLEPMPALHPAPSATSGEKVCGSDVQNLLQLSQQLYAHALTLQELIRNGGSTTYDSLRPRYDRQAEQQFEIFYRSFARTLGSE